MLRRVSVRRGLLLPIAFAGIALLSGASGAWLQEHNNSELVNTGSGTEEKITTRESQLISQIAKRVGPSVVSVNVSITGSRSVMGFYGIENQEVQQQAAGTGIIVSREGIIITNRHVVPKGTSTVSVTLSDGTELRDVSVIGRAGGNDSLDIAFLKINDLKGQTLKPAIIGDSSKVEVGDNVIAIGNALGQFQNTVTSGIISGYGRSVQAGSDTSAAPNNLDDLFQTDAAINEGNSGGPLVNLNGQVVGINTAVAGNAQNIGFAIPINDVRGLIDQIIKTGKFARPYLGVRYIAINADVATAYELKAQQGAFIVPSQDPASPSVLPDSPAAKAGLQERDIIVSVDNKKIDQSHSLTGLIAKYRPGQPATLKILRDGKTSQIRVTIGSLPSAE